MSKTVVLKINRCRDCHYVTNSAIEHDCAFTSAPHPTRWWCTYNFNKNFTIRDVEAIDERCQL